MGEVLVNVEQLKRWYPTRGSALPRFLGGAAQGYVKSVDGVSFDIREGEALGLVGESGSGKSTTGMMLVGEEPPTGGVIRFGGQAIAGKLDHRQRRELSRQAQLIFQNPYEALNPRYTIGQSIAEPIEIHFPGQRERHREMLVRAMERAGLRPVENYIDRYPHQLSGGQLQRAAIARAISVEPRFLVADEPVAMLDVSIRAGILNLLRSFCDDLGMSILYISHDLSTMRHLCSRIAVIYRGRLVEVRPVKDLLSNPLHPYSRTLISAVPAKTAGLKRPRVELRRSSEDLAPGVGGCAFKPFCYQASDICGQVEPELRDLPGGAQIACHAHTI